MSHEPGPARLLAAVEHALRAEGLAELSGTRRHELRVARTAVTWARRELESPATTARRESADELAADIRRGEHDDPAVMARTIRRLRTVVGEQLRIVRPSWLEEDGA